MFGKSKKHHENHDTHIFQGGVERGLDVIFSSLCEGIVGGTLLYINKKQMRNENHYVEYKSIEIPIYLDLFRL